jgi:hypothetical protein
VNSETMGYFVTETVLILLATLIASTRALLSLRRL